MDAAPCYTLLTLFSLFTQFILFKRHYTASTIACMPIYIIKEGQNAIEMGRLMMLDGWMVEWMDTP